MKEISVTLWELTKEDIKAMPKEKQILRYDSKRKKYGVISAGENSPAFQDKSPCYYFSFEEEQGG